MSADPWCITPREQTRYEEQFKSLQPQGGVVTGGQAKGFLLQSQLPPPVLGQIWTLSDTDADGKMDINEFSIACKLINLKLRGFEIPKALPPSLLKSLKPANGLSNAMPPAIPPLPSQMLRMGSLGKIDPLVGALPPMQPPIAVAPLQTNILDSQHNSPVLDMGMFNSQVKPTLPQTQFKAPVAPIKPLGGSLIGDGSDTSFMGGMQPMMQPMVPGMQPLVAGVQPMIPVAPISCVIPPLASGIPPMAPVGPIAPAQVISPTLSMSPIASSGISGVAPPKPLSAADRAASVESPIQVEWAVPQATKLKYTQVFNTMDRTRTGFLSGPQARNIMVQTKLPQNILAAIWALSDMDNDGKLGCEEFVLAMYLCDQASIGEKIPIALPADLIPPSFRRISRHPSISGGPPLSTTGSQGSLDGGDLISPASTLPQTSFEDKRKENYEKGQAELERRRKALMDIQRKEQEERERKEREEAEKREKARLEQERRRQQELEQQLQLQREIEQEREEQRKRQQEQREAARKEMERQRQLEWEKTKLQDLQQQRQKEQENVLRLKGHNQSLSIELSTLNEKVKELSQKICDTRVGVSSVKTTIDGMRTTRDSQVSEMSQLKTKLKDQNARLVMMTQEKARLEAKNKLNQASNNATQEQVNAAFSSKHITLKQLRDKYEDTQSQINSKMSDIKNNNSNLTDLKTQLATLVHECENLYGIYDDHRNKVIELKRYKDASYNPTSAWGTDDQWGTSTPPADAAWPPAATTTTTIDQVPGSSPNMIKYRAVYEFVARNNDEISFQPGDIVMVPVEQNAEPGWMAGEIRGHTGWFPESYVEPVDPAGLPVAVIPTETQIPKHQLEGIAEVPENNVVEPTIAPIPEAAFEANFENANVEEPEQAPEYYVASYPYQSTEQGDLTFNAGEFITVIKKEGDWWTGVIENRTGIFPSNYVQKTEQPPDNEQFTSATADQQIAEASESSGIVDNVNNVVDFPSNVNETIEPMATTPIDSEISQITQQANIEQQQEQLQQQQIIDATPDFAALAANNQSIRSKKPEIAQVIAPYESTSSEQLSLQRGQLIMIRKKTESGWWEGELQAKGRRRQVGWFPASYVKLLVGGRNSGRNTPVSASKTDMMETVLDKVVALYPYTAQNDDELSFEKDDIISVTGRDEQAWWRGEKNGVSGLFPSNYVGPLAGNP